MNRKITIENYESFFLDYLDGKLSDSEIIILEKFLFDYPELRKELEGLEHTCLNPEEIKHPIPENLKYIDLELPVNEKNFDFFLVAEQEGDLDPNQLLALNEFLKKHPERNKERQAYAFAKLNPEKNLLFKRKDSLKKSFFILYNREIRATLAMAASIALFITLWLGFFNKETKLNSLAASDEKKKEIVAAPDSTSKDSQKEIPVPEIIPEKPKQAVKKAATKISFKTGIPIASANAAEQKGSEIPAPDTVVESLNPTDIIKNVRIDPGMLANVAPVSYTGSNRPELKQAFSAQKPVKPANPSEYLTLGEFAMQKLTDVVFPKEKKELNAINLASAGLEKINQVAGTNMKLEASAKGENEKVISFNSRLISFTTPINRE